MAFYIYLFFSLLLCLALIIFIITFGIPFLIGAPFAVSTRYKIDRMLALISETVKPAAGDKKMSAVDLGSGDGRIVMALARNGFDAVGLEINPFLVYFSRWKIKKAGLADEAIIKKINYWQENFSQYDIVVLFGVFYIMAKLEKKLRAELKPGAIVICNHFNFSSWTPIRQEDDCYIYKK